MSSKNHKTVWNDRYLCHNHQSKCPQNGVDFKQCSPRQNNNNNNTITPNLHRACSTIVIPKKPIAPPCAKKILQMEGFRFARDYKLGEGRYSKVVRAFDSCAKQQVAIKVIDLNTVSEEYREKFLPRELHCWKRLNNPNNCFLYRAFIRFNYQFAVMEVADYGDLLSYVQKNGAVSERQARDWMIQLINGLAYMHARKVAHRDLKMENILVFKDNVVKISDYGFCQQGIDFSSTYCGSKAYSPPEILNGVPYDTFKADIWSLGAVGFVMVTNTMPFREDVQNNSIIVEAQRTRAYRYSRNLSNACKISIDAMMTFSADDRPSIKECRKLPWFKPQPSAYVYRNSNQPIQ